MSLPRCLWPPQNTFPQGIFRLVIQGTLTGPVFLAHINRSHIFLNTLDRRNIFRVRPEGLVFYRRKEFLPRQLFLWSGS